uniref:Uncharacterized protein n=1 Tax=Heterorhabditis bacteriophora TaxID=37862 RepID=A0A1I7WE22_HETBA
MSLRNELAGPPPALFHHIIGPPPPDCFVMASAIGPSLPANESQLRDASPLFAALVNTIEFKLKSVADECQIAALQEQFQLSLPKPQPKPGVICKVVNLLPERRDTFIFTNITDMESPYHRVSIKEMQHRNRTLSQSTASSADSSIEEEVTKPRAFTM